MAENESQVRAKYALLMRSMPLGNEFWSEMARSPFWAWFERQFDVDFLSAIQDEDMKEKIIEELSVPHVGDQGLGILLHEYVQSYRIANDSHWRELCYMWLQLCRSLGLWDKLWENDKRVLEAYVANLKLLKENWAQYMTGEQNDPTTLIPVNAEQLLKAKQKK